jgi:hypothetical protein
MAMDRDTFVASSLRVLQIYDEVTREQLRKGEVFQFEGLLLPEELVDLRRNVLFSRGRIVQGRLDTLSSKDKFTANTWQLALNGLKTAAINGIKLSQSFLDAFPSQLCLADKQKYCSQKAVDACSFPCQVESKFLGFGKRCAYPKQRVLPPYSGPSTQCPYQPSK